MQPELLAAVRPTKRPRTAIYFQLKFNADDESAENPTPFRGHPLREEQRRSVAWMSAQERQLHGLRGGVLADKMGYCKTATATAPSSLCMLPGPSQKRSDISLLSWVAVLAVA